MTTFKKPLVIVLTGLIIATAGATFASARGGWHNGNGHGGGYSQQISPEVMAMMEKGRAEMVPLHVELRAKQAELTSKIYQGADDGTIQRLSKEIAALQGRLTQGHITMQKQLAEAGVPMRGGCFMGGGMGYGPGHGGKHGWGGRHGGGHGPCYGGGYGPMAQPAPQPGNPAPQE